MDFNLYAQEITLREWVNLKFYYYLEIISFCAKCINNMPLLVDMIVDTENGGVNL